MSSSDPLLVLYVTHFIKTEKLDEYMPALQAVRDKTILEEKCMSFDVSRKLDSPNTFRVVMVWNTTLDAFKEEMIKKDYYMGFIEYRKTIESSESVFEAYENVGGFHHTKSMAP